MRVHSNTQSRAGMFLLVTVVISGAACLDPGASGNLVPRTAEEDLTIPQLSFRGSTFHVETHGDPGDPVIVMLHGGPGSDFRSLLRLLDPVDGRRLADDHFLVFWDQRGSGLSQRHDADEISLDVNDEDLDWLIDHFSPGRPVVLIGHSWGGMVASDYISRHPKKVAGAVLMEAGPLTGELFKDVEDRIIELDLFSEWVNDYAWAYRIISPDDHARADYAAMLGILGDAQPDYQIATDDRAPIWRHGAVAGAALQDDGMENGEPAWNFTEGLDRFKNKVLFEASTGNTVIGRTFQLRQMAFYASTELAVIEGAGHDHPWTHPESTLRPVFRYLDEIGY